MVYDDSIRQVLLAATAGMILFFVIFALLKPKQFAGMAGYELKTVNAHNEFHAIYVGVFLAQAILCVLAITRVQDAIIGDMVAVFILAQPFGRCIAGFRFGWPEGMMRAAFAVELAAGLALLLVRPSIA